MSTSALQTICPLGFASFTEDCPHAPCVECMGRLKDHMLEELAVMERQAKIAQLRKDRSATVSIWDGMTHLMQSVKNALLA